jgi:four helix bundle protein
MSYDEWERSVPETLKADTLWAKRIYRMALYLADSAWDDVDRLNANRRSWAVANQLHRALGSVVANIAEGYSRGGGKDRARILEIALGSAREARVWYYLGRRVLGDEYVLGRMALITEIIRLALSMIPLERQRVRIRRRPCPQVVAARDER